MHGVQLSLPNYFSVCLGEKDGLLLFLVIMTILIFLGKTIMNRILPVLTILRWQAQEVYGLLHFNEI